MNTFDLINVAFTALERRKESQPEYGRCDICGERPGTRFSTESRITVCDVCDEDDFRQMHRLPRFRNRDERDAYMAASKTHGEI